jgi:hypothetical protein
MYRSIQEIQKLFIIEGVEGGQVNVKTSEYLLSLPEDQQIEILTDHLENLKKDLARHEKLISQRPNEEEDDLNKAQFQILIQVTETLLSQV